MSFIFGDPILSLLIDKELDDDQLSIENMEIEAIHTDLLNEENSMTNRIEPMPLEVSLDEDKAILGNIAAPQDKTFNRIVRKKSKARIQSEVVDIVQLMPSFSDLDFEKSFSLTRTQAKELLQRFASHVDEYNVWKISIEQFVLSCLWLFSNQESYREVAERFSTSKGTICKILKKFCHFIVTHYEHQMFWPEGEFLHSTVEGFELLGFPNTVGAIGSTLFEISKPVKEKDIDPNEYKRDKHTYAIKAIGVCDSSLKFTYIYAESPANHSTNKVFLESELGKKLEKKSVSLIPKDHHLVGDLNFPLKEYLMTPFYDYRPLTVEESMYNLHIRSAQTPIKKAFELLKSRFKRLIHLPLTRADNVASMIKTCTILHNICVEAEIDNNLEHFYSDGKFSSSCDFSNISVDSEAIMKRNNIAKYFYINR